MHEPSKAVYAGNLSWTTTDADLMTFLGPHGAVSAEVKRHSDTKRSKGWGLIAFVSNQAAQAAVDTLNGTDVNGRPIHLRIDREGESDPDGAAGIYVGNLAWAVTDRELEEAFSRYHPYSCRVMRNMSGRSRGFAIIKFPNVQESTAAIETLNGIDLFGRKIECRADRGPTAENNRRGVFVGKLPAGTSDESLAAIFESCGAVVSATVNRKSDGTSRGWGIVKFESNEDAQRAVETLNGKVLEGGVALKVHFDRSTHRQR